MDRMKQPLLFDGIKSSCTVITDIDMVQNFDNKAILIIESKFDGTPLYSRQRGTLETFVKMFRCPCWVILMNHNTPVNEGIQAHCQQAVMYYRKRGKIYSWMDLKNTTVQEMVTLFQTHNKL